MNSLTVVAVFGFLGVMARYGVDKIFNNPDQAFPVTTFLINIIGSFLAGLFFALGEKQMINSSLQIGLLVGFCGGFTTFSAYTLQSFNLLNEGKYIPSLVYFIGSPILALISTAIPILLVKKFVN